MESIDIRDIDFKNKTYGFHFTPQTSESGLSKTGLEARIGVNSSGKLGKEAIPKVFFSNGITGALMTFNRIANIPADGKTNQNTVAMMIKDYYKYLPDRIKALVPEEKRGLSSLEQDDVNKLIQSLNNNGIYTLDYCEAFEFLRDWMNDNMYAIFEAEPSQYEHELTQQDIDEINNVRSPETLTRIQVLDEAIALSRDEEEIKRLDVERKGLSREVRKQCMEVAYQKRGVKLVDGFFDKEDYNEEHCVFGVQPLNNTHSAIYENNSLGKSVLPGELKKASLDGNIEAVTIIQKLFEERDISEEYAMRGGKFDVRLIEFFLQFLKLPKNLSQEARNEISQKISDHRNNIREILKTEKKGFLGILPEEIAGIGDVLDQMKKYQESFISRSDAIKIAEDREVQLEKENATEAIAVLTANRDEKQIEGQK